MYGAPIPTRKDLHDGHFGSGASRNFLKSLIQGKPKHTYIPHDRHDLSRCLVYIQKYTKGDITVREELTNRLAATSVAVITAAPTSKLRLTKRKDGSVTFHLPPHSFSSGDIIDGEGLAKVWLALFARWSWLTHEYLYSDRLTEDVLNDIVKVIEARATNAFSHLNKCRQEQPEMIALAEAEVDKVWSNYQW